MKWKRFGQSKTPLAAFDSKFIYEQMLNSLPYTVIFVLSSDVKVSTQNLENTDTDNRPSP